MDYRKHRPWVLSFVAIAFVVISFWYARPVDAPGVAGNAGAAQPPDKANQPPANIAPAPAANTHAREVKPAKPDSVPDEVTRFPEPKDNPKFADLSVEQLTEVIRTAIDDNDVETLRDAYPDLQRRGEAGLVKAVDLASKLIRAYGYGKGADGEVGLDPWGELGAYLAIFKPDLIRFAVLKTDSALPGAMFVQELYRTPGFSDADRVQLVGEALLLDDKRQSAEWMRQAAAYGLMYLPSPESADIARKFFGIEKLADEWVPRHNCVWVIARTPGDWGWEFIAEVARTDPNAKVRETAEYHLKARDMTTPGLYVMGLEPAGAASAAGVQVGDVLQSANGKPVEWTSDLDDLETPIALVLLRDGQTIELILDKADHGIKGMHIPPAFVK